MNIKNIKNMDKEVFYKCINIIDYIESYIRSIKRKNINKYKDFYPFIDYEDLSLYKDIDKKIVIDYTVGIILKSDLDLSVSKNLILVSIASYVLTIKYITDCSAYKPYSFLFDFIRKIDITNIFVDNMGNNKKKYLTNIIKLERRLLDNINYFSKNEN